jgi:hypothetical protein
LGCSVTEELAYAEIPLKTYEEEIMATLKPVKAVGTNNYSP